MYILVFISGISYLYMVSNLGLGAHARDTKQNLNFTNVSSLFEFFHVLVGQGICC